MQPGERIYIRLGDAPEDGQSRNYSTGSFEAGVSCYRARVEADGSVCVEIPSSMSEFPLATMLGTRPVYLVTGTEIGTGSDGEPVLSNATLTPLHDDVDITWTIVEP